MCCSPDSPDTLQMAADSRLLDMNRNQLMSEIDRLVQVNIDQRDSYEDALEVHDEALEEAQQLARDLQVAIRLIGEKEEPQRASIDDTLAGALTEDIPDIFDLRRRIADRLREVRTLRAIERAVERHRREAEAHEHVRNFSDATIEQPEN